MDELSDNNIIPTTMESLQSSSSSNDILLLPSTTPTTTSSSAPSSQQQQHFLQPTAAATDSVVEVTGTPTTTTRTFALMQQQQQPIFSSSYNPYMPSSSSTAAVSNNPVLPLYYQSIPLSSLSSTAAGVVNNTIPLTLIYPSVPSIPSSSSSQPQQSYHQQQQQQYIQVGDIKKSRRVHIANARPYSLSAPIPRRVIVPCRKETVYSASQPLPPPPVLYPPSKFYANNRLDEFQEKRPKKKSQEFNAGGQLIRTNDKSRGLRYFSSKVCEKVKQKGRTNYNEVADELVAEYFDSLQTIPQSIEKQQYDQKNIRRRVYDAINVLTALKVIEKEKKEIRWNGLPTSSEEECKKYADEKALRQESIRKKAEQLQELIVQLVAFKSLVQRNRENEKSNGHPADSKLLYLPFMVINTSRDTTVDVSIASDKTEFLFKLNQSFELTEDIEILKALGLSHGLDKCEVLPENREFIRSCLPPALQHYADEIMDGNLVASPPSSQNGNLIADVLSSQFLYATPPLSQEPSTSQQPPPSQFLITTPPPFQNGNLVADAPSSQFLIATPPLSQEPPPSQFLITAPSPSQIGNLIASPPPTQESTPSQEPQSQDF